MSEQLQAILIMLATCWGCATIFLGIGFWADHRKEPMHFYAGVPVDPKTITDVPAYNRENGKMWKLYSTPYWAAGLIGCWNVNVSAIVICLACVVGIPLLIWKYHGIRKQFKA